MKRIQIIIYFFLLIGCNSSSESHKESFTLIGRTNGISDGSKIQLFDGFSEQVLDSTQIKNDQFEFRGVLEKSPSLMVIQASDLSQNLSVFMENRNMIFDASNSDFKNAKFSGSKLHDWAQEKLFNRTDTIEVNSVEDLAKVREIELEFVEEYPESLVSAIILSVYASSPEVPLERIKSLYKELSSENKQNGYGQRISKTINTLESIDSTKIDLQIGDDFVDFEMMNSNSERVKLSENLGKFTLLEFWASWCGPCIAEMPNLKRTYEEFDSEGFKIFAVSLDKSELRWKNSINELSLDWINVSDLNGSNNFAARQYGIGGIPDNFLIDSKGKIIARNLRGEELNAALRKLLN